MKHLLLISILAPVAAGIDYLWLGIIAKKFYAEALGTLLRPAGIGLDIRLISAFLVYALMTAAIIVFVLPKTSSVQSAAVWGMCMGFVLYGVYNFTNSAVLTHWPRRVVFVDSMWGIFLCGLLSVIAYYIHRFL